MDWYAWLEYLQVEEWVVFLTIATSLIIGYQSYRISRTWRGIKQRRQETKDQEEHSGYDEEDNSLPREVREKSHAVANDVTVIRAGLRQRAKHSDPFEELIQDIRLAKWREDRANRH